MNGTNNKYRDYFDIDENYFPSIDDSAINAGAKWETTYPHKDFISLLTELERALSRGNNGKALWIEGAYGTGKSQCAYALRKILEVPEDELSKYWEKYEIINTNHKTLLDKLNRHKNDNLVVASRYGSGLINTPRDLFFALQESIKDALIRNGIPYLGENSLKESVIAWLEDGDHKDMINILLANPNKGWKSIFAQTNADEVLDSLRKNADASALISNILNIANNEGITALDIDTTRLINWITDVIDRNKGLKIVFIWDEFSDYFENNRESLSEFQRIAALAQNKPFYLVIVTHQPKNIYIGENDRDNRSKVSDRFVSLPITLPDNIAFELIGNAFKVKAAAKENWDELSGTLNARVEKSRKKVMEAVNIDINKENEKVMKDMMPLHPMAAYALKNIATAFQSNQRSMFDFIKTSNNDNVKAFQWFIKTTGFHDDHPLLTVDMLWDFFYEKGREHLESSVRMILDVYPQQKELSNDQARVLKAILIMQAIDSRLGGMIELFKPTAQNLSYVFEGIANLSDSKPAEIASELKDQGILISSHIRGVEGESYSAAVLAGDQTKIDDKKIDVRNASDTIKLVDEGELSKALSLQTALRLRFETILNNEEITAVTAGSFKIIDQLLEKSPVWHFNAVIAFAKDAIEVKACRKKLEEAVANEKYRDIIFIDALSTPLGEDAFEQYLDYTVMADYYKQSQKDVSSQNSDKAKHILSKGWRDRITKGVFIIYTFENQNGVRLNGAEQVRKFLKDKVINKFPLIYDFADGLIESMFKNTNSVTWALLGITESASKSYDIGKKILKTVWKKENYWMESQTESEPISKIKVQVDQFIVTAFDNSGQVAISDIIGFLENNFGFAPSNLSSFLAGFLLKEYGRDPYRYSDSSSVNCPMDSNKLAEMISNCYKKNSKPAYIVKMTAEEKAFCEMTKNAWGESTDSFSSAAQAVQVVSDKMRSLKFPIWCLEEACTANCLDVLQMYIEIVQAEGGLAHIKAIEIGRRALSEPSIAEELHELITASKLQECMVDFLNAFEGGRVLSLANDIGASHFVLKDIQRLFSVKHSNLWDKELGKDEIRKLLMEYSIIKSSNNILNVSSHTLEDSFKAWQERMKFFPISHEAVNEKFPSLAKVFEAILKIYKNEEKIIQVKAFQEELSVHEEELKNLFKDDKQIFADAYKAYLSGLNDVEKAYIKSSVEIGLFGLSETACNKKVKEEVEKQQKDQMKAQLFKLWKEKTSSANPKEWSRHYRTPILSCVPNDEFDQAKRAFETLNRSSSNESEIESALLYINSTKIFEALDKEKRDHAFKSGVIGTYSVLLSDIEKVRDELSLLKIEAYEWHDNPSIKDKVKKLADAEYNAGGSDKAITKIEGMSDAQLKQYLKKYVKKNITIGIEILKGDDI